MSLHVPLGLEFPLLKCISSYSSYCKAFCQEWGVGKGAGLGPVACRSPAWTRWAGHPCGWVLSGHGRWFYLETSPGSSALSWWHPLFNLFSSSETGLLLSLVWPQKNLNEEADVSSYLLFYEWPRGNPKLFFLSGCCGNHKNNILEPYQPC